MGGVVGQGETFWLHFQFKQRFTKIHKYSEYQPSVAFTGKVEGGGARKETNTFTPPEKVPNDHLAEYRLIFWHLLSLVYYEGICFGMSLAKCKILAKI